MLWHRSGFHLKCPRVNPFTLSVLYFLPWMLISFFLEGENDWDNGYKPCNAVPGISTCSTGVGLKQNAQKSRWEEGRCSANRGDRAKGMQLAGVRRGPRIGSIYPAPHTAFSGVALPTRIPSDYRWAGTQEMRWSPWLIPAQCTATW